MKKSVFFAAAAAIMVSSTMTLTAHAAVKAVVIGSNGTVLTGNASLQELMNGLNCENPGISWPDLELPDLNLPGQETPELPDVDIPGLERPETPDTDQPHGDSGSQNSSYVQQVADLVNQERAKAGLKPLTVDAGVSRAAAVRAQEIVRSFSHTRPDGSSFSTALTQNGVSFRGSGENIAYGQRTPEEVMRGWMNSQGHRANILNPSFTSIGVGYYQSGNGTGYWTQLFTY